MGVPEELKYSEDHEWILVEGDTAKVGISDFAQSELGDIVFVELPEAGQELKAGDSFANIESVKAVSEVYAPVSGVVTKVNEVIDSSPEIVNAEPFKQGWLIELKLNNPEELNSLMDSKAYASFLEEVSK